VDTAGTIRALHALRRVDVPALGEVTGVQPIRFRADDPWDRRYLAEAITLDGRLAEILPGLMRSASRHGGDAQGLAAMLGRVDGMPSGRQLARLVDPDRPLEDVLLGATIASLADGGPYEARWSAALRFRDAGATWGLVAMDRGVSAEAVLDALRDVVAATPLDFGPTGNGVGGGGTTPTTGPAGGGSAAGAGGSGGPGGTSGPGGGGGTDGGDGGGGGGGTGTTTPTLPPVTVPTTPTLPPVTTTTNPVGGLVDGVSHTVTTLVDTVGKVVNPPPDAPPDCLLGLLCS
jgi:hypothetical protein